MIEITDEKERIILSVNENGHVVVGRYEDLSDEIKEQVATLFFEMTGKNIEKTKDFLNYKDDEDSFCV